MKNTHRDTKLKPEIAVYREICRSASTPYAKTSYINYRKSNGIQLPKFPDPDAYSDFSTYALDYGAYAYLRKLKSASATLSLREKAVISFEETECAVRSFNRSYPRSAALAGVGHHISVMRRKIGEILGHFRAKEWFASCEWGPGATSSLRAEDATLDKKILESRISVSQQALGFARAYLEADIHMFAARCGVVPVGPYSVLKSNFEVVSASRLTTVPKSAVEDRVIDIQPTFNLFLQKGIGQMIRKRLRNAGIDLDNQTRNQWLASVAQRLQLCTIDLAKASDTISSGLVRDLIPFDWLHALESTRTTHTEYDNQLWYLHKFSAMGNGYTFELESLIFYAMLLACDECYGQEPSLLGVYGDDLIVPRYLSKSVLILLVACGFSVNSSKSFTRGRFYESCGKHYFDGREVTPPYQKEEVRDLASAIRCANRLFRWALRLGSGNFLDSRIRPAFDSANATCHHFLLELNQRQRLNPRRQSRKVISMPLAPFWSEVDTGLLTLEPLPQRRGMLRSTRLIFEQVLIPADGGALYCTALRRGCVVESPFDMVVPIRGRLRKVSFGDTKFSPRLVRFPDWY